RPVRVRQDEGFGDPEAEKIDFHASQSLGLEHFDSTCSKHENLHDALKYLPTSILFDRLGRIGLLPADWRCLIHMDQRLPDHGVDRNYCYMVIFPIFHEAREDTNLCAEALIANNAIKKLESEHLVHPP